MRVNNQNVNGAVPGGEAASARRTGKSEKASDSAASRETSAAAGETAGAASAEISSKAKEMAQAKEIATAAPDIREAKIAELKKRIAAHQYNVKPEDVADRMVQEHMHTRERT